jgi:hypothetical protein
MQTPGDFNSQLTDLTITLSGMVAEKIAWASKDMEPNQRRKIVDMIETQLPEIIANTVMKSASLHSATGVEYFEQNLESMADMYVQKFLGKI